MLVFPIGNMHDNVATGTMNGVEHTFFEPNGGVKSNKNFSVNSVRKTDQTQSTSKKAEPFAAFEYSYEDIFDSEYQVIDQFTSLVGGPLRSFYVADLTKGVPVRGLVDLPMQFQSTARRHYSAEFGRKANYALLWDSVSLGVGHVTGVTADFVQLQPVVGVYQGFVNPTVYPLYEVFMGDDAAKNWETGAFIDSPGAREYGFVWKGKLTFTTRWPVE